MVEFADVRFMSAREKAQVLRQWETFLKYGCKWEHFGKALYNHLIQHCSFIAHYDRAGFYGTYFHNGEDTARFMKQFDAREADGCGVPRSVEYGGTWWVNGDYEDINKAMIEVAGKYIPGLVATAEESQRNADVLRARALLAKHGLIMSIIKE